MRPTLLHSVLKIDEDEELLLERANQHNMIMSSRWQKEDDADTFNG